MDLNKTINNEYRKEQISKISEELSNLRDKVEREKFLWREVFGVESNIRAEVAKLEEVAIKKVPEIIEAYERRMDQYVAALTEAQAEKRENIRRQITDGALSQQLALLEMKCETELKTLDQTADLLKEISSGELTKGMPGGRLLVFNRAGADEGSDTDWEWDFEDASEEL